MHLCGAYSLSPFSIFNIKGEAMAFPACMSTMQIYLAHHLPDLHDVVFRHRTDDPWLIGVPGEVRDLGCVTSMNELDEREGNYIFECSFNYSSSYSQTYGSIIFVFDAMQKKSNHTHQQLWGAIFCVFWRLLLTDFTAERIGINRYNTVTPAEHQQRCDWRGLQSVT